MILNIRLDSIRQVFLCSALFTMLGVLPVYGQSDLNILIIGSTHSFSEREKNSSTVEHEEPFNPSGIVSNLEEIFEQDPSESRTANVVFEDLFLTKEYVTAVGGSGTEWDVTYHCYSLAQYFMWPEGREDRLANLRGDGGTEWHYIVLLEDPYVLANFPGMYAEAVRLYHEEISKGDAELILMSQWLDGSSGDRSDALKGLAFRVGDSLDLRVAPAAKAWASLTGKDTSSSHPTPNGAYLAAASVYSILTGRNASSSNFNPLPSVALQAFQTVENMGVPPLPYTGVYTEPNKFQMKYVRKRRISFNEYGTSTEEGFFRGVRDAVAASNMTYTRRNPPSSGNPVDFSYSRGNDTFEENKQYRVDPAMFGRTFGFPMGDHRNTGAITMKYGIDKRYYFGSSFIDGTDLGIAYDMLREGEVEPLDVRATPVRLLWSKMSHYVPAVSSHRDGWHLSNELDRAVGAYMFTLTTGRCPIDEEPSDQSSSAWKNWFGRKIGYETAWQMSHMTARVPGFRVVPGGAEDSAVTPDASETLSVQFLYPPKSNVTVTVDVSDVFSGSVEQSTLTFTPTNYDEVQLVEVSGMSGTSGTFPFEVILTSASADPVFDGLRDEWNFENTRTGSAPYQNWIEGSFSGTFIEQEPGQNPDGDLLTNIQEFAFGLDPTVTNSMPLDYQAGGEVLVPGMPVIETLSDFSSHRAVFVRRQDHATIGLIYEGQFSADLEEWTASAEAPEVLTATSGNSGLVEAMGLAFPAHVPMKSGGSAPPRFFRIKVSLP